MTLQVGEVIGVSGVTITLKIFEDSNKETIFYNGTKFKGVSIREYLLIQRGFKEIVCIVEGEYLDESRVEIQEKDSDLRTSKIFYTRKVEVKPIGYFQAGAFREGIKFLPMIKDQVFLASEKQISKIYGNDTHEHGFIIGAMLKENLPISLPWERLFNTHIGIFGNTGSGKSNTLTKLYTTLFENKKNAINGKSQFVVIDFNGEYTRDQLIGRSEKLVYELSTKNTGGDKFPLSEAEFWNAETLGLLFKATPNTQIPFIKRVVDGWKKFHSNVDSLQNYFRWSVERIFTTSSPKRESLELLIKVAQTIEASVLESKLKTIIWHSAQQKFKINGGKNLDGTLQEYIDNFKSIVDAITLEKVDFFDELIIRINLQLINDLISNYVQFEHIQPLLKRIEASASSLKNVVVVKTEHPDDQMLTVISLRKCNQDIKKILPLLLAKHYYEHHKSIVNNPPQKTVHLIIDEAHNILSQQSVREEESWKDYRLELFEEIIKEGRKFGVYLTLSSQRPADISPTVMSQIHNFFIHRLVNDRDLFLLDNTVSTLDAMSRSMIPNLPKGCCVITGTSFALPLLMQVAQLKKSSQPDSEDVDLKELWS